jgi:hypothetical protein
MPFFYMIRLLAKVVVCYAQRHIIPSGESVIDIDFMVPPPGKGYPTKMVGISAMIRNLRVARQVVSEVFL